MQLVLSKWLNGAVVCDTIPSIDNPDSLKIVLDRVYKFKKDSYESDGFAVIEEGNFLNILFPVISPWAEDNILDEHENSKIFHGIVKRHLKPLLKDQLIYLAFYKAEKPDHPQVPQEFNRLHALLDKMHKEVITKADKNQVGLANIILLGIQAVGKTSIIKRLINGEFSQTRPTLAPQMLKLYFEQIDFKVYDVGGQKSLRKYWTTSLKRPQGILWVLDCTHNEELQGDALLEFNRMMQHYFVDPKKLQLPKTIPVLILANKFDIKPEMTEEKITEDYNLSLYDINSKVALVSAKTGDGLLEAFKWFSQQMKTRVL
jgi:GTPase SAR1 family protein